MHTTKLRSLCGSFYARKHAEEQSSMKINGYMMHGYNSLPKSYDIVHTLFQEDCLLHNDSKATSLALGEKQQKVKTSCPGTEI